MIKIIHFLLIGGIFVLSNSCTKNPYQINVEKKINTQYVRFDQLIMSIDSTNFETQLSGFEKNHEPFFSIYTHAVLSIGGTEVKSFGDYFLSFLSNPITRNVNADIQKTFPDVESLQKQIDEALSYYLYYYPEHSVPKIYYFQSGFNQRFIVDSALLGIALDMSLGANSSYYKQLGLPDYLSQKLDPKTIGVEGIKAYVSSDFPFEGEDNLASHMIYQGKLYVLLNALFPNIEDYERFMYTPEQWAWLEKFEKNMWDVIIRQEMLYETDHMKIKNMMDESPFTQIFGNMSAPRAGAWIGWQIVKSYQKNHPEVSLQVLLANRDLISILNQSQYQP